MPYQIFLSHSERDTKVAKEICRIINNSFDGDIKIFLAKENLKVGDEWRSEIKKHLQSCDALISIVTPESVNKPWLYIEWSPFWIDGKKFYTLLSDDMRVGDLLPVLQDRQSLNMMDVDAVRVFFRTLAEDCGHAKIPFDKVDEFVESVRLARKLQQKADADTSFGKYRESLLDLPREDNKKHEIADYFYGNGEYAIFEKIINLIRDDNIKCEVALQLIENGDLDRLGKTFDLIQNPERLETIAIAMIDKGYQDSHEIRDILEDLCQKNQTELRKVGTYLADLGQEDSDLFNFITLELMTNNVEIHRIATYFINNKRYEKPIFLDIIEKFDNFIYLRKLLIFMDSLEYQRFSQFIFGFKILIKKNWNETVKVIDEVKQHDPEYFSWLHEHGHISEKEFNRINNHLNNED